MPPPTKDGASSVHMQDFSETLAVKIHAFLTSPKMGVSCHEESKLSSPVNCPSPPTRELETGVSGVGSACERTPLGLGGNRQITRQVQPAPTQPALTNIVHRAFQAQATRKSPRNVEPKLNHEPVARRPVRSSPTHTCGVRPRQACRGF